MYDATIISQNQLTKLNYFH